MNNSLSRYSQYQSMEFEDPNFSNTTAAKSKFVASNSINILTNENRENDNSVNSQVKTLKTLSSEKVCHDPIDSISSGKPYELVRYNNIIVIDDTESLLSYDKDKEESSDDDEVEVIDSELKQVQKFPDLNRNKYKEAIEFIEIDDSPLSVINIEEDETNSEDFEKEKNVINDEDDKINFEDQVKWKIKEFTIPCLKTLRELEKEFKGRIMDLNLKPVRGNLKRKQTSLHYFTSYKHKKNLLKKLEEWEYDLNDCCPNEPYIAVENKVDNSQPPEDFQYVTKIIFTTNVKHLFDPDYLVGCSCERCNPNTCDCPTNSGGKFAYDRFGRVQFEPGQPIYECNAKCSCSISCRNRVVQRGRTVRVTIFRTPNNCGWGVKTMDSISKNQFVTEYVGELITTEVAEERGKIYDFVGQTYLFDLDYNDGECLYTIDAKKYGNISHFINHSCEPNLNVYGVWNDTLDPTLPRIALFAARDIEPGEELTFDYLMTGNDSSPASSPIKRLSPRKTSRMRCNCGSKNCRTYLY